MESFNPKIFFESQSMTLKGAEKHWLEKKLHFDFDCENHNTYVLRMSVKRTLKTKPTVQN